MWDAPIRIFHWLLALSFTGAFVTAELERYRNVHVTLVSFFESSESAALIAIKAGLRRYSSMLG